MSNKFSSASLAFLLFAAGLCALAQSPKPLLHRAIDEGDRVALPDHAAPVALNSHGDLGVVADDYPLAHLKLVLNRSPEAESALARRIEAMHDPRSPAYHEWLTARQIGERYGIAPADFAVVRDWLTGHGFTVHGLYQGGFALDFSGSAAQVREAFHTELHNIVLANGERHVSNLNDAEIPAALAPAIQGIASLHDFRPRPHSKMRGPVTYDRKTQQWKAKFDLRYQGETLHAVGPYDFAAIYDLLPLWDRGYTGKGVTIALIEDSNLAHPSDWSTFRSTFGLDRFTHSSFEQIYPNAFSPDPSCRNPGQNGDEIEAALDVEWASASAPDAKIQLVACANTNTAYGLDTAILNLLDTHPPDIISDSYGYCETISGAAEVALENMEEQQAAAQGVTFFIAQGDNGADQCSYGQYSDYGINSGDNTASAYVVDVGGTDFMEQYNSDVSGVPVSKYWSSQNDPITLQSALSYVPEIPWNDSCASKLLYTDPDIGDSTTGAYGIDGFCNTEYARDNFYVNNGAGSGEASTCFTGKPATFGVVGGTCKGNPKPSWQAGVPGIPNDGRRDQPDISFFAADGVWGSLLVECLSDVEQGGAACTPSNDVVLLGGGGTSFASPAMAGIQALIDQKFGKQGNANYVYYRLAAKQFAQQPPGACNGSTAGELPAATCVFRDITQGDNAVPCGGNKNGHYYDCFGEVPGEALGVLSESTTKSWRAYQARAGYDFPTGLGSLDATRLFDAWPVVKR